MHQALSDQVSVIPDIFSQIASVNTNGLTIDTQGWDGAHYIFNVGAMVAGATFDARIVSSANANMVGNTNLTGTVAGVANSNAAVVQLTNASNLNVVEIDVWRPTNRYIRSAVMAGTANSTFSSVCILYRRNAGTRPAAANANVAQVIKVLVN